ncbi:hypothetical protein PTH_0273 [Pelotomaculum thermopropionicum SI]|uniref:Uncharacterized protein n=1 Tax=Pelotomaculum thermopropionicum (strain DSM 13744 / JCM 10971 / SI) TaxID=370438 RepID=A5D5N0_PELTS|nr:hypothetical protein PTH_0273 [Pelotomaculum thermopropionicum SI]
MEWPIVPAPIMASVFTRFIKSASLEFENGLEHFFVKSVYKSLNTFLKWIGIDQGPYLHQAARNQAERLFVIFPGGRVTSLNLDFAAHQGGKVDFSTAPVNAHQSNAAAFFDQPEGVGQSFNRAGTLKDHIGPFLTGYAGKTGQQVLLTDIDGLKAQFLGYRQAVLSILPGSDHNHFGRPQQAGPLSGHQPNNAGPEHSHHVVRPDAAVVEHGMETYRARLGQGGLVKREVFRNMVHQLLRYGNKLGHASVHVQPRHQVAVADIGPAPAAVRANPAIAVGFPQHAVARFEKGHLRPHRLYVAAVLVPQNNRHLHKLVAFGILVGMQVAAADGRALHPDQHLVPRRPGLRHRPEVNRTGPPLFLDNCPQFIVPPFSFLPSRQSWPGPGRRQCKEWPGRNGCPAGPFRE